LRIDLPRKFQLTGFLGNGADSATTIRENVGDASGAANYDVESHLDPHSHVDHCEEPYNPEATQIRRDIGGALQEGVKDQSWPERCKIRLAHVVCPTDTNAAAS